MEVQDGKLFVGDMEIVLNQSNIETLLKKLIVTQGRWTQLDVNIIRTMYIHLGGTTTWDPNRVEEAFECIFNKVFDVNHKTPDFYAKDFVMNTNTGYIKYNGCVVRRPLLNFKEWDKVASVHFSCFTHKYNV